MAATGYGWWATSLHPSGWPTRAAILVPGVTLLVVAPASMRNRPTIRTWLLHNRVRFRDLRRRPRTDRPAWLVDGVVVWAVLVIAVVVWQLLNFFLAPRVEHPTLSSIINQVNTHPVRLVMFLGWLALGWDVTKR